MLWQATKVERLGDGDTILDQILVGTLQAHRQLNLPILHNEKFLERLLIPRVPLCRLFASHDSTLKYLRVYPVIKQSGQAAFRVYYTFYQPTTLYNITLSPDSVTNLGTLNPDSQKWTLNANYQTRDMMDVLSEDYFEPTTFSTNFDTVLTWVKNDPENACTGQGYAMLHVADSESTKTFTCTKELSPETRNTFYLEIDYKSDLELWVQLLGFEYLGTTAVVKSVMTLYPTDEWHKVYINLGKTWSWFNYNVPLTLFFQASNPQGVEGNVYIDNVKVISMK